MAHRTQQELSGDLAEAAKQVEVGARYVHFKDHSKEYIVKMLAIMEATEEVSVIYEGQYDAHISFIRPLSSWLAEVEWEGETISRFTKI